MQSSVAWLFPVSLRPGEGPLMMSSSNRSCIREIRYKISVRLAIPTFCLLTVEGPSEGSASKTAHANCIA